MDEPLRRSGDDLLLDVRLLPKGGLDRIDGPARVADGRVVLAARVRAAPEDGKANAALVALVARAAAVPRSRVRVERGATSRLKTLRLASAGAAAEAALRALLET